VTLLTVSKADGSKCARCWKVLPEVGEWESLPDLCLRCVDAVLLADTGLGLHETAMQQFDARYCAAIAGGASKMEAETIAVKGSV